MCAGIQFYASNKGVLKSYKHDFQPHTKMHPISAQCSHGINTCAFDYGDSSIEKALTSDSFNQS